MVAKPISIKEQSVNPVVARGKQSSYRGDLLHVSDSD